MMKHACLVLALAASGCVEDAAPEAQVALEIGGKCPDSGCGLNSPLMDNGFFHDLNLDGLRNDDGWAIESVIKGTLVYDLSVSNGRISARLRTGSPNPPVLTGSALVGLQISLNRLNPQTLVRTHWVMSLQSVLGGVEYRADRADGGTPPTIESYKFHMQSDSIWGAMLCTHGPDVLPPTGPRPITKGYAVVYAGEQIDAETKTISSQLNPRWFNIGCAETAVAKLQLYGHTQTAMAAGFTTTRLERQTLLKMLVADYCGTGKPFTVAGQPLEFEDDRGTMVLSAVTMSHSRTEARWTPGGVACLTTPRVIARPSDEAIEEFADGNPADLASRVNTAIRRECGGELPPPCPAASAETGSYHLESYNHLPLTI